MLMMTTTNINIQREKERKKERWNAVTMESLTNQRRTGIVCWCVASIYYIPSRNDLTRLDSTRLESPGDTFSCRTYVIAPPFFFIHFFYHRVKFLEMKLSIGFTAPALATLWSLDGNQIQFNLNPNRDLFDIVLRTALISFPAFFACSIAVRLDTTTI